MSNMDLKRQGRTAGAIYLVVVLAGMFCLAWVPAKLGGAGDPQALLDGFKAQPGIARAGIVAFALMQVAFLLLPLALYRVFADVDRRWASAMVALACCAVPIGMMALAQRMQALTLMDAAGMLSPAEARTGATLAMQGYRQTMAVTSLFWGLWLIPLGMLVLRSGRIPRLLGVLLLLGGVGYVLQVLAGLWPDMAATWLDYARIPQAVGEVGTCLWLLLFGARSPSGDNAGR